MRRYGVALLCNWSYSLFYIVSELWGSVGVSVLFWQLANDIIPVWQAQRFYPLFGQLANIAPICAGQTVAYFAKVWPAPRPCPISTGVRDAACPLSTRGGGGGGGGGGGLDLGFRPLRQRPACCAPVLTWGGAAADVA